MGPRKLKWTDDEEAAIRDGISKHGVGKWSDILKDPEFSGRLFARSNVDLKDKWRNMRSAMNGASRNRHKSVQKDFKRTSTHCDKSVALISEACDEDKVAEPEAPSLINEASQNGGFVKLTRCRCRFDDRKLEGLTNVKQASSSMQIQVQHGVEYELADSNSLQAELDAELMRIAQMSPEEAAAAAAAAVEKAEAAIAEAEAAEKEAVEAESVAEEAEAFAEKLRKKLMEKKVAPAPKRGKLARSKC